MVKRAKSCKGRDRPGPIPGLLCREKDQRLVRISQRGRRVTPAYRYSAGYKDRPSMRRQWLHGQDRGAARQEIECASLGKTAQKMINGRCPYFYILRVSLMAVLSSDSLKYGACERGSSNGSCIYRLNMWVKTSFRLLNSLNPLLA